MGMQVGGQTCGRTADLAVREDPPIPVPRPGPIHRMGRAVRYRAHTPSQVWLAQSATPTMNRARPSRARSSNDLCKRTRMTQLVESITRICRCCADVGRSTSALTFEDWWRCLSGRQESKPCGGKAAAAADLKVDVAMRTGVLAPARARPPIGRARRSA